MSAEVWAVADDNLQRFLDAPAAVLIVTRSDCRYCVAYETEVRALQASGRLGTVRLGALVLDRPGATQFKRAHPWLAELEFLPQHLLYRHGQPVDRFAASRASYLVNRLKAVFGEGYAPSPHSSGELPC